MPQIQFFTPEQEARIPDYQEKWRQICLSTEPIDRDRAEAAVRNAYAVMKQAAPKEIVFCASPRAALDLFQAQIERIEIETPQDDTSISAANPKVDFGIVFTSILSVIFRAIWQSIWQSIKSKAVPNRAGTRSLLQLLNSLSSQSYNSLGKHIDSCLPKGLSTKEIIEQAYWGASPLIDELNKSLDTNGNPGKTRAMQDTSAENMQGSFLLTAASVETQLFWLPGKRLLFRGWLKHFLKGMVSAKISGIRYPQIQNAIYLTYSNEETVFLLEYPAFVPFSVVQTCAWLDFAFWELDYPYSAKYWEALRNLVENCGLIFATDDLCVICDRPTNILVDEDRNLHAEGEPCLQFSDGFSAYARHGTALPEKYGAVYPSQWESQWVSQEPNITLRRILMQGIGAVRLCQELPTSQLDTLHDYELVKLDDLSTTESRILKRIDSVTGGLQAVFVPWNIRTVRDAIRHAREDFPDMDFPEIDSELGA